MLSSYSRFVCALLTVTILALYRVPAGVADADKERERARELFQQGVKLYRTGKFQEACAKFEASLAHYDGVGSRGKLAECYERIGRVANAWRLYREVERLSRSVGDDVRAQVAADRMKRLEARLARLVINVEPSADIAGLSIRDNAEPVRREMWGETLVVEPGQHTIRASADGYQTWHERVRIGEGESRTVAVPTLRPEGAGDLGGSAGQSGSRTLRVAGLALAGAGAVGLIAGGLFGGRAYSQTGALSEPCQQALALCSADERASDASARTNATRATYATLAGTALIVGGVVTWWLGRSSGGPRDERAVTVRPTVQSDRAGLVLTGSF